MNLVFDTETTGLFKKGVNYKKLEEFKNSRLLSICWLLTKGENIVEQSYFIIKPDKFKISKESINIHGITEEEAEKCGTDIKVVLNAFNNSIKRCSKIIAHNFSFDETIIKSELFRQGEINTIEEFDKKHKICTMIKGRLYMNVRKYPKLSELYKFLYNENLTNAHCALNDTKNCLKCFIKLFPSDPNIFYFGDKEIKLSEEQQKIVFEEHDKHMLILAGAGSGKSSTLIIRIKYLLDNGVPENSIVLTTFTRNAAADMRDKLYDIMGYKTDIVVGTIDSIAKYHVEKDGTNNIDFKIEEYTPEFLKLIKEKPLILKNFKYLFVDEVQDINKDQFDIMMEFYKSGVCIIGIGDDSQNIYEFRGSDIKYILNFSKYFKHAKIHTLVNNFRSTPEIVAFANASIKNNVNKIDKKMIAVNISSKSYNKPIVCKFNSQIEQNNYVLQKINEINASKDYRAEVDTICIMSMINSPLITISSLLSSDNIDNYYSNSDDDSKILKRPGCVSLNTIHKSKGLQWKYVFLINMNDDQNKNIYYFNRDDNEECNKQLEEKRRLFYVAVTRAETDLFILSCPNDNNKKKNIHDITRFIYEIPNDLYTLHD